MGLFFGTCQSESKSGAEDKQNQLALIARAFRHWEMSTALFRNPGHPAPHPEDLWK